MRYKKTIWTLMLLVVTFNVFGQQKKDLKDVDLDALINETQFSLDEAASDDITLVWWVPTEFWATIYAQDESVDAETAQEIVDALDDYTLVLVVDGTISEMGNFRSKKPSELVDLTSVTSADGKKFKPLDHDDLSFEAQLMIGVLKPVLSNLLGKFGEGMHIMAFTNGGEGVIDAYKEGGSITYDDTDIDVATPLSSLLVEKECPEDGEKMDPKWNYCPIHGTKLQ